MLCQVAQDPQGNKVIVSITLRSDSSSFSSVLQISPILTDLKQTGEIRARGRWRNLELENQGQRCHCQGTGKGQTSISKENPLTPSSHLWGGGGGTGITGAASLRAKDAMLPKDRLSALGIAYFCRQYSPSFR